MKIYHVGGGSKGHEEFPVFVIQDGKLYRTIHHRLGWSQVPDYEIGSDGKVYRTAHNRLGPSAEPDYEFRNVGQYLYPTRFHPEGERKEPRFILMD